MTSESIPSITNYHNFDLLITRAGDQYRAFIVDAPGGEGSIHFAPPFGTHDVPRLRDLSDTRRGRHPPDDAVQVTDRGGGRSLAELGQGLFEAVFRDRVYTVLIDSLSKVAAEGAGLRLRLRFEEDAAGLASLPWETLYDPNQDHFVGLGERSPILRYLPLPRPRPALLVQPPLRLLAVLSSPAGLASLDMDREWLSIREALAGLEEDDKFLLERLGTPSLAALHERLLGEPIHILHFVGHGAFDRTSQAGSLALEDDRGELDMVPGKRLATILRDHPDLRLVYLNACEGALASSQSVFTGVAQNLVQGGVPAAVAMQAEITDSGAIQLARTFYTALATGRPVDAALTQARVALSAAGSQEWAIPVLFSRSPDNRLFELREALPTPDCPYPGMAPFTEAQKGVFFGRQSEIDDAVARLRQHPFLAVVGPSGSGKSSLIYAGVIPKLRKSHHIHTLRPSDSRTEEGKAAPRQALARLLDCPAGELTSATFGHPTVLFVDQLEEVFTQAEPGEAQAFLKVLGSLIGRPNLYILLTVRADFYGDLMLSPLWQSIRANRLELTPLGSKGLWKAIVEPAARVGVTVDEALAVQLIADAAGESGVLPLVQETLVLLWDKVARRQLGLDAYRQMADGARSGLQVAIDRRASLVYGNLSPKAKPIARRIFLRLIQFGQGRADTRRQQTVEELRASGDDPRLFDETLATLAGARLLTTSGEVQEDQETTGDEAQEAGPASATRRVDIAHEALIAGWPRLQDWLTERSGAEQTRRRLEDKAVEWLRLEKTGGLLDEIELAEAERWLASPGAKDLGYSEALPALVEASRTAIQAAEREEDAARQRELDLERKRRKAEEARAEAETARAEEADRRAEEQATSSRRLRWLVAGLTLVFLVAVAAALWAVDQRQEARNTAGDLAVAVEVRSTALKQAEDSAQLAADREATATIALGAEAEARTEAEAYAKAEATARHEADVQSQEAQRQARASLSRELAATALNNLSQAPELSLLLALEAVDTNSTFEAEDALRQVLHGSYHSLPLALGMDSVSQAAFSPDGKLVLTANDAGMVQVSDAVTGRRIASFEAHTETTPTIIFAPDGQSILVVDKEAGAASLWQAATGTLIAPLSGHSAAITTASFSPSGEWIVTASQDNTARVWETASGTLVAPLTGHGAAINTASFSASGEWIVTASQDNTARVWETATGQEIRLLQGTAKEIGAAAFSLDDQWIVLQEDPAYTGDPTALSIWEAQTGERRHFYPDVVEWTLHGAGVLALLQWDPGGVRLVEAQTGNQVALLQDSDLVSRATLNPGATRVATIRWMCPRLVEIWDTSTGRRLSMLEASWVGLGSSCQGGADDAVLGPKGQRVVTLGLLGEALLWNPDTGQQVAPLGSAEKVAFSPDGTLLMTTRQDGVRLYDATSGDLHRAFPDLREAVFSPLDDRFLGLGGETGSGTASLWLSGAELATLEGYSAFFDPSGELIATIGSGTVRLWDASTGAELPLRCVGGDWVGAVFATDGKRIAVWESTFSRGGWVSVCDVTTGDRFFEVDAYYPSAAEFSPDGRWLVWWTEGGTVAAADLDTGEVTTRLLPEEGEGEEVWCGFAGFSSDGSSALINCSDSVRVMDADWQERFRLQAESATFNPDGKQILARAEDGTVSIWNAMTGEQIGTRGEEPGCLGDRCSPDGKRSLVLDDQTVRILETATGRELLVLRGHAGTVVSAEYSPDGQRIVTISEDQTARVWDAGTGQALSVLRGHKRGLNSATFSPDGKLVLTASDDGTARLYLVHLKDLEALAQSRVTRQLTCQERQVYLHEEIVCPTPIPTATAIPAVTPTP